MAIRITPETINALRVTADDVNALREIDEDVVDIALSAMEAEGTPERLKELSSLICSIPQDVTPRTIDNGVAPSTLTFRQAIIQGKRVLSSQYPTNFYFSLDPHLPAIVDILQSYPSMYDDLTTPLAGTLAYHLVRLYYVQEPTPFQRQYSCVFNAPLLYDESPRLESLMRIPMPERNTLLQLYDVSRIDDIPSKPMLVAETILRDMVRADNKKLLNIARRIGMFPPSDNIRKTMLANLPHYVNVLQHTSLPTIDDNTPIQDLDARLNRSSDIAIAQYTHIVLPVMSRKDYIETIRRRMTDISFFLVDTIVDSRAQNAETGLMTPVQHLVPPFLVYGTVTDYKVHELTEFDVAWENELVDIASGKRYNLVTLNRLRLLASRMAQYPPHQPIALTMIRRIDGELIAKQDGSMHTDEFKDALTDTTQNIVHNWLWQVFFGLMYARGWRGPGNRYPTNPGMRHSEKMTRQLDYADTLYQDLVKEDRTLAYIIETMPIYNDRTRTLLGALKNLDVCEDNTSIITTVYYYLSQVFDDPVNHYNVVHQQTLLRPLR